MLLIALTFAYIVFTTINFGLCFNSVFRTKTSDFATVSFLGLFGITLSASIWAVFGRINWEFHIALLAVNLLLFGLFKNAVTATFRLLLIRLRKLPGSFSIVLAANILLIIAKSAASPLIPDNESYYIQSVKWLNEYGFVKGLGNLHIFLAQMSGWHVAQSAFSFSFLYSGFNDLSGFCLILANLYAIFRLEDYLETKFRIALVFGILPAVNVLLLFFSGAPSPDVPVIVLTFLALDIFVSRFKTFGRQDFSLLCSLILFALFIKITVLAIVILPLYLLVTNFRAMISRRIAILGFGVFALFVVRNCISSGLPLFPLSWDFGYRPDFAIPENIMEYFYIESRPAQFGLAKFEYESLPLYRILLSWLCLPGIHGFSNCLTIAVLFASPIFIVKSQDAKPLWIAYSAMIFHIALLFCSSPHYRFIMPFTLFFTLFCAGTIISGSNRIISLIAISSLASAFVVFYAPDMTRADGNSFPDKNAAFQFRQIVFPHPNSRFLTRFERRQSGNLNYFSPL